MRLVASFTVCTGLSDHVSVVIIHGEADEALFSRNVSALGVGVNESGIGLGPLSEASILSLFVDFTGVATIEHGIEHDLGIVAVGIGPGTEALGVRKDAGVLSH